MKLAIVGSRGFPAPHTAVPRIVRPYLAPDLFLITGDAKGVDQAVRTYALGNTGLRVYAANWDLYGRGAGFIRNELIVKEADQVVALWDGASRGTKSAIDLALTTGTDLLVVFPDSLHLQRS